MEDRKRSEGRRDWKAPKLVELNVSTGTQAGLPTFFVGTEDGFYRPS